MVCCSCSVGAEIDLVLEFGNERREIEIKRSSAPATSCGLYGGCRDSQAARETVIYPCTELYNAKDNVDLMPVTALVSEFVCR